MLKLSKPLSLVLCLVMIIALLSACSGSKETLDTSPTITPTSTSASKEEELTTPEVVNNATPVGTFPIAEEPITLVVAVNKRSSSYQGEWEDLDWIKQIQEYAGITLQFNVMQSAEERNLIFASRDFPDIMFGGPSDTQIQDAAMGGDIYQLDELIDKWSPNWKRFFAENEYARKVVTYADGHIWSLPIVRDEPSNGGLRDQWLINKEWLDELGMDVPTTTTEFREALQAFKDNAGTGNIPNNVIPYYIYGTISNVGGCLDIINSFGVMVANERQLVTVDDSGKVVSNYINEDIKEPLKYLHGLYKDGLCAVEGLTDDWDTYITKTRSDPPIVGSYHSYQNPDASNTKIVAMGPLDAENGKKPYIRSQTNHIQRNYYTIFKTCQYPEIAMRFADLIADEDWSIQAMYGMYGDEYLTKNDDGSITMLPYPADAQGATSAPMNSVPFLLEKSIFEKFTYAEGSAQNQRNVAILELYAPYTIPTENLYPNVMYTEDQSSRLAELKTDINDYIASTFANWMLNGGIDEGWDEYVNQLNKLGIEEYISILQDALDNFNAN